jgi:trehalose-phosphatase
MKTRVETLSDRLPSALKRCDEIIGQGAMRRLVVCLDYDGTLTPIVAHPDQAVMSKDMRRTVEALGELCTVAIISGRDVENVRSLVGLPDIYYAGSHGFDIVGPEGANIDYQAGLDVLPALDEAEAELRTDLQRIPGLLIERKKFSVAVHYRRVPVDDVPRVEQAVMRVLQRHPDLRNTHGKKVFDLQPDVDWHKGKAVLWLQTALHLDRSDVLALYIGDDITDEDAFHTLHDRGIGIMVRNGPRTTAARYALENTQEVQQFLQSLIKRLQEVTIR